MRHACALGLNLQNKSTSVSDSSKEIRHRVWWAVCSVDFRLAVMTGRSSAFMKADCTVALPRAAEEESFFVPATSTFSNQSGHPSQEPPYVDGIPPYRSSGPSAQIEVSPTESFAPAFPPTPTFPSHALFFLLQTKLGLITNEVLNRLYRSKVITRSWAQVQLLISALTVKLEQWQTSLPLVFDFSKKQRDQQFVRQRMCLGFFYYSTSMIISRPCLCRVNRNMPHASDVSKEFNQATAAKCVHAAKDMLDLLPNEPNPVGLYKVAPWWCLVHHLVQAATVSMLELSYRADHLPREIDEILQSATKAVQWLRSMAPVDLAAYRAWRQCEDMLHKVASMVGRSFDQFPEGDLPDGDDGGGSVDHGVSRSFFYPSYMPAEGRIDGSANLGGNFAPTLFHPTEALHQAGPFREGLPLQAQIYTSYDEFFPPTTDPPPPPLPPETTLESPSDFLSMFPSPDQMEGLLSGELDDSPNDTMTHYDWARN